MGHRTAHIPHMLKTDAVSPIYPPQNPSLIIQTPQPTHNRSKPDASYPQPASNAWCSPLTVFHVCYHRHQRRSTLQNPTSCTADRMLEEALRRGRKTWEERALRALSSRHSRLEHPEQLEGEDQQSDDCHPLHPQRTDPLGNLGRDEPRQYRGDKHDEKEGEIEVAELIVPHGSHYRVEEYGQQRT